MSGAAAHGHRITPGSGSGNGRRKIYTVLVIENQEEGGSNNSDGGRVDNRARGGGAQGYQGQQQQQQQQYVQMQYLQQQQQQQQQWGRTSAGIRLRYCKAGVVEPSGNDLASHQQQHQLHHHQHPHHLPQQQQQQMLYSPSPGHSNSNSGAPPTAGGGGLGSSSSSSSSRESSHSRASGVGFSAGPARHGSGLFVLPVRGVLVATYHLTGSQPPSLFADRPHSFGLHSPDTLPQSESEFKAIASSFGLHSPDNVAAPSEKLHPSYNPRLFCDGGLYLDPDIIGESLFSPMSPCCECVIAFLSYNCSHQLSIFFKFPFETPYFKLSGKMLSLFQ